MLSARIIPCLDVDGGRVVKGIKFKEIRDAGDPVEVAKAYQEQKEMRDDVAFYVFNCDALNLQKMYQRMKEIKNEKDNS